MPQARSLLSPAWFQSLYGSVTKVIGGLWTRLGGQGWTRFRFLLPGSRFDYEREAGDLWLNPVVGLCLDWLGNRFPRPLLHVSKINARTNDHIPLGRHQLTDLWNRPNLHYGRRTMEKAVGLSLKCDGNAYIYKVRDNGGKVVELWWIPHYRILPTWPPDGSEYIDGYRVWLDTNVYWLPRADVIHVRDGIDPRNERLGLCALRSSIREVCTINEESGYRAALLRNFCVPGLAIVPRGDGTFRPNQEDADAIRDNFKEKFGGDNRGTTAVFGGPYEVIKIGFSPEEMSLTEFPTIPTARILAAMGVAPMSLGLPDPGKTYANLQEANRTSWGTIVATQELVAEHLRWELLPEFGEDPNAYTCEYDYTHIQELQESLDALHTRAREDWKSGLATQNEAREMIGLEPDPDGDRWYPGTGSPEEQEQQDQQHQERLAVLQNRLAIPKPTRNGDEEDEKGQGTIAKGKPGSDNGKRLGKPGRILKEESALNGNGKKRWEDDDRFPFDGSLAGVALGIEIKYNECHDEHGQFCETGGGGGGGSSGSRAKPHPVRGEMKEAHREGKGKDAKLVMHDGSAAPSHVPASAVSEKWTNVKVSVDPKAEVLVTGKDEKGRGVQVNSKGYESRRDVAKFSKTDELLANRAKIDKEVAEARKNPATKEEADVTLLMRHQATRVGSDSDTKAKVKAYGATTLEARHVVQSGDEVRLKFVGKKGVEHDHVIQNPEVAKMLVDRKNAAGAPDAKLFNTNDSKVRDFVKERDGGGFTPKDLRTAYATESAHSMVKANPTPAKSQAEFTKRVNEVAVKVSHVLGNKPAEARGSYIDPRVFHAWRPQA